MSIPPPLQRETRSPPSELTHLQEETWGPHSGQVTPIPSARPPLGGVKRSHPSSIGALSLLGVCVESQAGDCTGSLGWGRGEVLCACRCYVPPGEAGLPLRRPHLSSQAGGGVCGGSGAPQGGAAVLGGHAPAPLAAEAALGAPVPETPTSVLLGPAPDKLKLSPAGLWVCSLVLGLQARGCPGTDLYPGGPLHTGVGHLLCLESTTWAWAWGRWTGSPGPWARSLRVCRARPPPAPPAPIHPHPPGPLQGGFRPARLSSLQHFLQRKESSFFSSFLPILRVFLYSDFLQQLGSPSFLSPRNLSALCLLLVFICWGSNYVMDCLSGAASPWGQWTGVGGGVSGLSASSRSEV